MDLVEEKALKPHIGKIIPKEILPMSRKIRVIFNALIDAMQNAINFVAEMNYEDFISDTKTVMRLSEPRKL